MSKTLCDLTDLLKTDIKNYAKLVDKPKHLCRKCGRAANRKKSLCEPVKLHKERG